MTSWKETLISTAMIKLSKIDKNLTLKYGKTIINIHNIAESTLPRYNTKDVEKWLVSCNRYHMMRGVRVKTTHHCSNTSLTEINLRNVFDPTNLTFDLPTMSLPGLIVYECGNCYMGHTI